MSRNRNVDMLKGIACLGVVIMHCSFPGTFGKLIAYLFKFAVPIFFMVSGYYLYSSNLNKQQKINKLKHKAFRTLKLLLLSEGIYLVYNLILISLGIKTWQIISFNYYDVWINIFTGTFFNGTLWFIYALLYTYLILIILEKVNLNYPNRKYLLFAVGILMVHIVSRVILKHFSLYDDYGLVRIYRSALLYGLPFIMIGYYLKNNKPDIKLSFTKTISLFFFGYCISIGQYIITKQSVDQDFGTLFSSIALFIYFISEKQIDNFNFLANIGKYLSMYIYILHYGVITFINIIITHGILLWISPILSVILTIIFASFVYYCKNIQRKEQLT